MNAFNFLSSPVAYALGWTLLHAVWQGFALVLSTAVILHLLRSRSSALRYRVGTLTLLAQLLASVATFGWYYKPAVAATSLLTSASAVRSFPVRWQTVAQTMPWHQQIQQFLENHLSQFVLIYLIGVGLFGLRLTGGWFYLQHLSRTATSPASDRWASLADQLRATLVIRSVIRVRESARIAVPMVVGMLKPVLLLPVGLAAHLSVHEVEAVLAHELAHVKRHDYAVNLLQSIVEVLYFFHPALWWLSARVREEREHCCDDLAVKACGGNGRILAQALARVEELRLTQVKPVPVLAMALTAKRQFLLYRVRRMLGVPTRPAVSNGSLAGLTLATLLLLSASVYAVQQQQKPKASTTQPKPTRRHKAANGAEFGLSDNRKVDYVIWEGKKLPAARVTRLQRQLDQVMAGQLSLDAVPQADRDILLTILETNQGFQAGMSALGEGLAHIDYDNITASALSDVVLSQDKIAGDLAKVNYDAIVNGALASAGTLSVLTDSLDQLRGLHQQQIDSLSRLMAQQSKQIEALHRQMEKLRFPVEEFERSQETLEWRKQKLMEERGKILEKRRQLLNSGSASKNKVEPDAIEKQLEVLEPAIKKQELGIDELNKQLEDAQKKLEDARMPMEKLERESEQLGAQMEKLSSQLNAYSNDMARLVPVEPMVEYEYDLRNVRPRRISRSARSIRGVVAPRAIARPNVMGVPAPTIPAMPATPHVAPTPPPAVMSARPATPRIAPKVAPAPKPARPDNE